MMVPHFPPDLSAILFLASVFCYFFLFFNFLPVNNALELSAEVEKVQQQALGPRHVLLLLERVYTTETRKYSSP